ncbi:hypothetical protein A3K91_1969 [Psychrobacter alimentarius]|uniref:Uncharacterized protein n=1 Tax=Psychrobacter alimentarius TaxID=261164 RepID=A0ABM5ZZP3_9GAMM|nr:hypothetical protein A3K91_1969 [Psychrobacter alimentarius]
MTLFRLLSLSVLIVSAGNTLVHASASEYEDTEQYDLAFRVSYPYYELPLTDQDFSGYADSFGIEQFDTLMPPITDPSLLEQLASLHLGASDSGFFQLHESGDYQAFLSYGLYEDEDEAYVTEDNPYGAYVDQENILVLIKDGQLLIVALYDGFKIDKNLNVSYD